MNLQAETAELIAPMPFSMAENGELARHMLETAVEYKELRMMYACAIKEVQTKFEVLNTLQAKPHQLHADPAEKQCQYH